MLYDVQRETDRAIEHYERALKLRRQIGDRLGEGSCLLNLSLVFRERGLYKDALAHMEKALKLQQRNQQRWDEANTRNNLGILYLELGDPEQAHTHLLQALQITRDIGDATGEAYALANLGLLAYEAADSTTAVQHLTHALALAQQQGDRENEAGITSYLALLALQRCDYEEALKRGEDALSIHADLEIEDFIADDYATLAAAYLALRDLPQALDCAQQSCAILDAKGGSGPEFPQRDYFICYQVFAAAGQSERAHVALQNAARIVEQRASTIDDPSLRRSFCEGVAINKHILAESRRFVAHDVAGRCESPSRRPSQTGG
jgi:tetratricopeptide (TPR) repeat protein